VTLEGDTMLQDGSTFTYKGVRRYVGSALEDPVPSVGSLMKPTLTICLKISTAAVGIQHLVSWNIGVQLLVA